MSLNPLSTNIILRINWLYFKQKHVQFSSRFFARECIIIRHEYKHIICIFYKINKCVFSRQINLLELTEKFTVNLSKSSRRKGLTIWNDGSFEQKHKLNKDTLSVGATKV